MTTRRAVVAVAVVAVIMGVVAPSALAVHWPFFGGDSGRSGYQPVDEGTVPVPFLYAKDEPFVKSSIVTTTGGPATQRLIFGTRDGRVHLQILESGAPVGPEEGTGIDDGAADADVLGTRSAVPGANAASVSFADTSGATGLGQVFIAHNDDDLAAGGADIEIAQFDEATGARVRADVDVAGTDGFTINSSLVATAAAADGSRVLFFVASNAGGVQALFRVPVAGNAATTAATVGAATNTGDIDATPLASPTLFFRGDPATAFVAVGTATRVRSYAVANLTAGPAVAVGGPTQTPSVPVQPSGLTPNPAGPVTTAPFLYVASLVGGATVVNKLNGQTLAVTATSAPLPGAPAPALATDQEAEADTQEGKVFVTTGQNLYFLTTAGLDDAGTFSAAALAPGTTGFQQTTAAASGDYVYVTNDQAEQFVLRQSDAKPVTANQFTANAGATALANTGVGQPSISRGFVQFSGGRGVFVYRNTDAQPPSVVLTSPAEGATVTGTVTLSATAFESRGIARVDFRANGQVVGSDTTPDSGSPFGAPGATYSVSIDSTALPRGTTVIDAVAVDASGLTATSAPRRIVVANPGGAGDDRPPIVRFTAPARNALVRTRATVSATASDDNGIRSVAFRDDERTICTDTTAPYSCTYTPRGDDVGRNTLFVVATDTAGQTASDVRAVRVDRFLARISARTTPARDGRAPFRFSTTGWIVLPARVTRAQACRRGRISVQYRVVRKTVSNRRVDIRRDCTFRSVVSFKSRSRLGRGRLGVLVRFTGNTALRPRSAPARTVRVR